MADDQQTLAALAQKTFMKNYDPPQADKIEYFMALARQLAKEGEEVGEVPIGALVVKNNQIIGRGYNRPVAEKNPFSHAEIVALQQAAKFLDNYRLVGCDLYVTLEPCLMCAGAILQARIQCLIFGTQEPKSGVAGSIMNVFENKKLNAHTTVLGNVDALNCAKQLKDFFSKKR